MRLEKDIVALGVTYKKPEVILESYTVNVLAYNAFKTVSCEVYVMEFEGKDTLIYIDVNVAGELTANNILNACIEQLTTLSV